MENLNNTKSRVPFRQRDLERAIRALRNCGIKNFKIDFLSARINVLDADGNAVPKTDVENPWDKVLEP